MEFNKQYLTYEEYKELGGTLNKMPFNLLEFKARKKIDERTLNRLLNVQEIPQDVKLCVFDIINIENNYVTSIQNKAIASENTDGYSISYNTEEAIKKAEDIELENAMESNLYGVVVENIPILYLGVE